MARNKQQKSSGEQEIAPSGLRAFQLSGIGLRRVLGSLEADLLEAIWLLTRQPGTSNDETWTTIGAVCAQLGPTTNYKTVQTVMNRLVDKGLLVRRTQQRAYAYRAAIQRDQLVAQLTHTLIRGLVQDFGEVAVAQLVQTLQEISPDHLAALERLATGNDANAEPPDAESPGDQPLPPQPPETDHPATGKSQPHRERR